jgi:CheY-like chemotaxis protein
MEGHTHYILLADDDPDDQELLVERFELRHPNTHFKVFQDGADVLKFLDRCAPADLPALLILDYKMPIVTGEEVLKAIQGQARYSHIRKIIWSTSDNPTYVNQCLACGADRYFIKPRSLTQLDSIIAQITDIYAEALSRTKS